jgi:hypothetical protein
MKTTPAWKWLLVVLGSGLLGSLFLPAMAEPAAMLVVGGLCLVLAAGARVYSAKKTEWQGHP